MARYKFSKKTTREVDTSAGSKTYEGPRAHSKVQQIHLTLLPKLDELDGRLPNVAFLDDSAMWATSKVSNPFYGGPEAFFHDEGFPKNMESQFQRLSINDYDPELENISLFAIGAPSIEEQLQRMRDEKGC